MNDCIVVNHKKMNGYIVVSHKNMKDCIVESHQNMKRNTAEVIATCMTELL
jgi:hypothetical protein